jgi:hypothetical protein
VAVSISWMVGLGVASRAAALIWPLWQYPHCGVRRAPGYLNQVIAFPVQLLVVTTCLPPSTCRG